MGYPTSIFAPTTKATGDTIQAAHINDAQTEIVQIETALINGPITIGGASTFAQSPVLPRWPCCKVTNSANQQMPSGSFLGLNWDTESYDSAAMHSTASNSSRVLLNSSGVWAITAQIDWVGNATPNRFARIFLNDTTALCGDVHAAANIDPYCQQITVRHVATSTTDYVTVQGQASGSTASVYGTDTTYGGCWLAVERVTQ